MADFYSLESSGVKARLVIHFSRQMRNPQTLRQMAEELEMFYARFWSSEEVDWKDCVEDPDVYIDSFFENRQYIVKED